MPGRETLPAGRRQRGCVPGLGGEKEPLPGRQSELRGDLRCPAQQDRHRAYGVRFEGDSWRSAMKKIDPKVDEAIQTLNMKDGPSRRKLLTGTGLVSATAAASALLAACSSSSSATSTGSTADITAVGGNFPKTPPWQFWFVNHVTTNLLFVPTKFGSSDAAAMLGLPTPRWGGSTNSIPSEMITYMEAAISAKAAGIATTVINSKPSDTTFATPVD